MGQYTDLLMAVAMQESKGHSPDIMQSSESIGLPRNTIKNPDYSIKVGTKYFKKAIDKSNGNVHLALQSYNYGTGFIDYVKHHGGAYSRTIAEQFARSQASARGWTSYGDPLYVDHVLRYYHTEKQ
ncbi:lysozyme family protein [Terrilactibacillus sp. S3-3]|nr:lysozyme family protein [Terrilactibacillus sp. S3-3]